MKYSGFVEAEDLKQEGYLGLCEAVRQYDASKGVPFIHYASFWIKQAMMRYIDNYSTPIRIPVHARRWAQKYNQAVQEYRKEWGDWPSEAALCALLGIGREKLHDIQKSVEIGQTASLSEPIGDEDLTLEESIASDEEMEEDAIYNLDTAAMKHELWEAVGKLPDKLPEAVRFRYQEGRTLKQTGESLGVSIERVRWFEKKAFRLLQTEKRGGSIRRYYEEYLAASSLRHVGVESFRRTHMSAVELEVFGW